MGINCFPDASGDDRFILAPIKARRPLDFLAYGVTSLTSAMTEPSKFRKVLRRPLALTRHIATVDQKASALIEGMNAVIQGMNNQSQFLDRRFEALIQAADNQSQLLNSKLEALIQAADNQSQLLSRLIQASETQSRNMTERFKLVAAGLDQQSRVLNSKLDAVVAALHRQPYTIPPELQRTTGVDQTRNPGSERPLLIDEKTYNTSHPDYDATVVRNFPGKILNAEKPSHNPVYQELKRLANGDEVPDAAWTVRLKETLVEAKSDPYADLVVQRREATEQYMAELRRKYHSQYNAGWVNLDAALFLYWLVRRLQPKTIVQCGICNGLSSAFMVLALAANGTEGKLYGIDIPPVFNPKEPFWTGSGQVYGHTIPEGKTSGWMVPEAYRNRLEIREGDSKVLLPKLVENLPAIDLFYHDSDHTYNHMMFEFREAKRKLARGGLVVADDISWNASLWDFADENLVPAYNFKGDVGVTFF
jgi:predicted O-methyltransferase YrrM